MSSHVFVKVKIRPVDARWFVREFVKEYGDQIENARKVKTEGDALDAWLGWMDGARPARLSAKDGCWRFTGEDVAVIWWVNEGFYKFFNWCEKEYGNRIEDARKLKTEGDELDAWLGRGG